MRIKNFVFIAITIVFASSCINEQSKVDVVNDSVIDVSLTAEEQEGGVLTPEIMWKFGRISDIQLSPDESIVAYCITYYDVEKNKGLTHIYKQPVAGGEPIKLTQGENSCYNPRWLPDGVGIAFISSVEDLPQIFTMEDDGSNKLQISVTDIGVNSFELAPDAKKILYCADVKIDDNLQDIYPDLPDANVIIANELMYRHWNVWSDGKYSHIFVGDFNKESLANVVDIMEGTPYDAPLSPYFDNAEMKWSPDGRYVAYTCKKYTGLEYALNTNSDIYLYDTETGITNNVTEGMMGYDKYPTFSNNMQYLAWQSMSTPGYESDKDRLMIMDLSTGEISDLTRDFDQNVSNLIWSADDKYISFISGYHATFQIYNISLDTREVTQITDGTHNYHALIMGNSGIMVGEKMSMKMASEIFVIEEDGIERQLSFVNQHIYDHIKMGNVEERWVKTTDGKDMLVWLILPPNFDETKEYPAILYCQGGPQSAVSQFWSYRWNFQIMAAGDYIIVAPNRRGLPTFGQEWNAQISGDYGGQNMDDYLSAIDELKKEPFIDEDRLGAVGASYGGFSVFWLAGHHEGRFKAFISHCGMFNLESQYAGTEEMFFVNHDLGGAYWEKDNDIAKRSYENSPHNFVDKWDTPIMIITGAKDFRIPYTESLQAFNAAQLNGVESKLLFFPDETHFVLKPQNAILWQREFRAWLDKHLK